MKTKNEKIKYIQKYIKETNWGNEYIGDVFIGITYNDIIAWLDEKKYLDYLRKINWKDYRKSIEEQDDKTINSIINIINIIEKYNNDII